MWAWYNVTMRSGILHIAFFGCPPGTVTKEKYIMSATTSTTATFSQEALDAATQEAAEQGKTVVIENRSPEAIKAEVQRLFPEITQLDPSKSSQKEIVHKVNEVIAALNLLSVQQPKPSSNGATRDRGPVSERTMTDDDARKVMLGDLVSSSHKDAAGKLGLSYGQIYSARKGFTFKSIYKEAIAKGHKW